MFLKYIIALCFFCFSFYGNSQETIGFIDTKLDTTYDSNSNITGIGYIINSGKYKGLKFGNWIAYYSTGEIKSKGLFLTEKYMECNDGGILWKHYSYKAGQWKYFYKNQFIKAEGTYETQIYNYPTTCKGGYNLIKQKVGKNWIFYSEDERIIKPEKVFLKEMEEIEFVVE